MICAVCDHPLYMHRDADGRSSTSSVGDPVPCFAVVGFDPDDTWPPTLCGCKGTSR